MGVLQAGEHRLRVRKDDVYSHQVTINGLGGGGMRSKWRMPREWHVLALGQLCSRPLLDLLC